MREISPKRSLLQLPAMGLPPELWFHILSFLSRHPRALLSCQLTCFDWAYPCRLMLRSLESADIGNKTDLEDLIQDIAEAPFLQQWIRSIHAGPGRDDIDVNTSELFNMIPLYLPTKLPMVTVISLYGGKHPSTIPLNPTSWTLFMAFRRLEDLGLWYLTINSMSDLIRVISSLPKLKSFLTTDIDWANSNTVGCPPPKRRQGKPRLSRLNLRAYKGNPSVVVSLMEWFAWSCDMDALTSLEIHIYTMHPCPTLATILQECQFPSLTDLDLEFVPGMLTQSFPGRLSLPKSTLSIGIDVVAFQ